MTPGYEIAEETEKKKIKNKKERESEKSKLEKPS
jgi:hypothetical protein